MKLRDFWSWFSENESILYQADDSSESLLAEVGLKLTAVYDGLTFEIGPVAAGGRRLFVVSAGGLYELIEPVLALVREAPAFERWQIEAFKPPRPLGAGLIRMHGKDIGTNEILCTLTRELRRIAVTLYFPELPEEECATWGEIGFALLDAQLGEYVVMTEIGSVDFAPVTSMPPGMKSFPLDELPQRFEQLRECYRNELIAARETPSTSPRTPRVTELESADRDRWSAVQSEGLVGAELAAQYFFFSWEAQLAAELETALREARHSEVTVQSTTTVAGIGFSVSGILTREIASVEDLKEITEELSRTAHRYGIEFDGYSLQRAADYSGTDLYIIQAQELIEKRRYEEALSLLEQGLSEHVKDPELAVLYAYACVKSGRTEEGIRSFDGVSVLFDDSDVPVTTLWNAACTSSLLGRDAQAISFLDRVFRDSPEFLEFVASDPDFERLRGTPEFRALLMRYAS